MMMISSVFTQERARDKDAVISDLQSELRRTQARLNDESRKRAMAEANVIRLQRNKAKQPIIPIGDIDDGYQCPNDGCYAELIEDYSFCPGCGAEIDWRTRNNQHYDNWREYRVDENLAYDLAGDR